MSTSTGGRAVSDALNDEIVARYLHEHPDFFQNNSNLLESLNIPHETGVATSLIERQVSLLRQQKKEQGERLQGLIQAARNSEQIMSRMQHFTLETMHSHSIEDVVMTCQETMGESFNADYIGMQLIGDNNQNSIFVSSNDASVQQFTALFEQRKPLCGRITESQSKTLFSENAEQVRSTVLIPLQNTQNLGVIALGSKDPARFNPSMGTLFMAYLGEVVTASLSRYMNK